MNERKFPFEAARNIILPIIAGEVTERVRRISQILYGPRCFEIEERAFIPYRLSGLEHLKVDKQYYGLGIVEMLDNFQEEMKMAAKKKGGKKRSNAASLKRSTSRSRSRSRRPAGSEVKRGLTEQPIDTTDREQAEGHGNQRALMTRAQQQVGSVSGAEGLMPREELLGTIDQLVPPQAPRDLVTIFSQVTEGYAEILRHETEQYIGRVKEALGSNV